MSNLPPFTPDVAARTARLDPVLGKNTGSGMAIANSFGPGSNIPDGQLELAVPALGMSALGLYLLYQKYQQDKQDREQEKTAAVDWQAVRAQLPGFHGPDILLGGAAGLGGGLLYDYIRGGEKGKRFPTTLRRALIGALIGAGGANLVGDRFRRYLTNSVVPAGYDGGNILAQLKPRSWQHVYDAAIKDVPSYDPAAVQKFVNSFGNPEVGRRALAARSELDRIAMGVHLHDAAKSVWQRNVGESGTPYYSLNEKNKDYLRNLAALMLPARLSPHSLFSPDNPAYLKAMAEQGFSPEEAVAKWNELAVADKKSGPYHIQDLFTNPAGYLRQYYSGTNPNEYGRQVATDLFSAHPLVGHQQIVTRNNGPAVEGMTLDRHDVTPGDDAVNYVTNALLRGKFLSKDWRNQQATGGETYSTGQTNSELMKATLGRMVWDRVLRHENPWVAQKFRFTPTPAEYQTDPAQKEYSLQFMRNNDTPALAPMSREAIGGYLQGLQSGKIELPAQ